MSTCSGRRGVLCGHEATEGDDRCVFHSEVEGKNPELFEQAVKEVRQGGEADWSGWVVPIACDFGDATFTKNADFGDVAFTMNANFRGATFAQFAIFDGATFTMNANFRGATFAQFAIFNGATFTMNANFRGAAFAQFANFDGATFTERALFAAARFIKDASFEGATFTKDASFAAATFTKDANFVSATFAQFASFAAATFTKDATFMRAAFAQFANFEGATFTQFASFAAATFTKDATFMNATFAQRAFFLSATFTQPAFFSSAMFTEDATFSGATFTEDATFMNATFAEDAYFMGTTFKRLARFERVTIKGRVTLENCKLIDQSSFDSTDVSRITFRLCELSGAVFANSHNLHEATFDRCKWGKLSEARLGWLNRLPPVSLEEVVWEETQARAEPTPGVTAEKGPRDWFREAEVVYREVRWSLESRKNFQQADQFAVREMEMRRLAYLGTPDSPWYQRFWGEIRANFLSVPGAYHLFGNYGQSILRPTVGMLFLVFLLAPLILICTDITVFPATFPGYSEAVLRTLRIVALLPDLPSPQGSLRTPEGLRQVAEVFFRLAGPFFALLFVIAVRRRVRR